MNYNSMNYEYTLDSYAWSEFFDGTTQGAKVKKLLDNYRIATSVIALAELSDKCSRENRDFHPLALLIQTKTVIIPLTSDIAIKAGKLKQELRKTSKNISLADAIHFQTAKSLNAIFVTGDPDFKNVNDNFLFLEETTENENGK